MFESIRELMTKTKCSSSVIRRAGYTDVKLEFGEPGNRSVLCRRFENATDEDVVDGVKAFLESVFVPEELPLPEPIESKPVKDLPDFLYDSIEEDCRNLLKFIDEASAGKQILYYINVVNMTYGIFLGRTYNNMKLATQLEGKDINDLGEFKNILLTLVANLQTMIKSFGDEENERVE